MKYINALPFSFKNPDWELATPDQLNQKLRTHELDIALTSSIESLSEHYQILPGFGLAGENKILSVNLYTKVPVSALTHTVIGISSQSATSSALLQVLCQNFWHIEPVFETLQPRKAYQAFLLIGDDALNAQTIEGFQTIDLNEAWYAMTGLPFVFGVFIAQKTIDPIQCRLFQKHLEETLTWSESNLALIIDEASKRGTLPQNLLQTYFRYIKYRLSDREMNSLALFREMIHVPTICAR